MIEAGEYDRAVEILDKCQSVIPEENFPLDIILYGLSNERDRLRLTILLENRKKPLNYAHRCPIRFFNRVNFS